MRTMRWALPAASILCGLSLLLSGATAVLWVRSHHVGDWTSYGKMAPTFVRGYAINSNSGCLTAGVLFRSIRGPDADRASATFGYSPNYGSLRGFHWRTAPAQPGPAPRLWQKLGFDLAYSKGEWPAGNGAFGPPLVASEQVVLAHVSVPHWFVCLLTMLPPIAWAVFFRRRRLRQPGFCRNCGYDLRATLNRCPECGSPVPANHVPVVRS